MIQQAAFSGLFYPQKKIDLQAVLTDFYHAIKVEPKQCIKAILSPHAGYQYSGQLAAESFFSLRNQKNKTAIIISPSHRHYFSHAALLDMKAYQIPLGHVDINQKLIDQLCLHCENFKKDNVVHQNEHGIEVLLPFIRFFNTSSTVVPILMGNLDLDVIENVSQAIVNCCNLENTQLIISSDFSHFFSAAIAEKMDKRALDCILRFDIEQLYHDYQSENIQLCGIVPTLVGLNVLKKWNVLGVEQLSYFHSGYVNNDFSRVVGYSSMRFF